MFLTPFFVQMLDFLFEVRAYDTSHLLKRNGESRSTGSEGWSLIDMEK